MFHWINSAATKNGEVDCWIYTHKGKTLAVVEKGNGMYRYRVPAARIDGTEQTRTDAMRRAREVWEESQRAR